jgi:hypothetical protein
MLTYGTIFDIFPLNLHIFFTLLVLSYRFLIFFVNDFLNKDITYIEIKMYKATDIMNKLISYLFTFVIQVNDIYNNIIMCYNIQGHLDA